MRVVIITVYLLSILTNTKLAGSKTIHGALNSRDARIHGGHYITSFCFYGDGYCKYKVAESSTGTLYLFTDTRWQLAKQLSPRSCNEKLSMAEFSFSLSNNSGELTFVPWQMINYWHVVYADVATCDNSVSILGDIDYTIQLLNKDIRGKPTDHFSYDEAGLLSFSKLITFVYFISASLYGQRLWQTVTKGGPMHQVIKELSVGVIYHAVASLFMLTNLHWYAKDGMENSFLSFVVLAFYSLTEYKMLCMTIKVSFGWMFGSSKNMLDVALVNRINFTVAVMVVVELFLLVWDYLFLLCCAKCLVVVAVGLNIHTKISEERSSLRKDFYISVIKSCFLWFLGLPCSALVSAIFPSYHRLRITTFGQRTAEMVAIFLLYKLFVSRSLYWEVSSLSSATLPLRLDKAFGKKSYQTYSK